MVVHQQHLKFHSTSVLCILKTVQTENKPWWNHSPNLSVTPASRLAYAVTASQTQIKKTTCHGNSQLEFKVKCYFCTIHT
jgi:hypothetical protein